MIIHLNIEYNIMGRLEKIEYPSSEYVSYTYDANGNRLTMKDTRINYGDETFSWEYDNLNRVTKEIYPDDEYITHAYTVGGKRASVRRTDNTHMKYTYDSRGRLSTIVDKKDSYAFTYTYNNDNTLDKIDYPNLTFDEFEYDSLYRISNITSTFTDTNPDTVWYSVDYTYDDVGNKTKAEWDGYSGSPFKYSKYYTYDNIYQLLTEKKMNQAETSRLYEYQYQFDNAGNRTQMKYFDGSTTATTTYHYNDLNQMWLRCKTYDYYYTYDDNGNLTIEDYEAGGYQREFTWNEDNRLKYVDNVVDSKEVEYTYDPLGRRIMRKDVDNNTYTYYYYDGLTVLAEKKKVGAGNPTWDKLFTVAGGAIGNILRSNLNYYHYDAMGNLVFISDFDGTPSQSFEQEAYGNVKSGSQSGYHLTTKEYDSIGELYYFNRRWYDPQIGRFISKDIIFNINEINLYVFCLNNPISLMDVKGSNSDWREVNPIEYPWYIRVFRCLLPDLFEEEALHTAYVCSQLPGIAETIDSNNECPVDCQLYDPPPGREGLCRTLGNLWGDFRDWIGF